MEEKQYDEESIRLVANSEMLKSRGFMLFAVDPNGRLTACGDTSCLNQAEFNGLLKYVNDYNFDGIEDIDGN